MGGGFRNSDGACLGLQTLNEDPLLHFVVDDMLFSLLLLIWRRKFISMEVCKFGCLGAVVERLAGNDQHIKWL